MSTRGITVETARRPKIHPHPTGWRGALVSFRFLANNSPRSSFQRGTDFTLVRRVISEYTLYPRPFASPGESKGHPRHVPRLGRSSGQFHYVRPADDRTPMSEKNSRILGAFEWSKNASESDRRPLIIVRPPHFLYDGSYIYFIRLQAFVRENMHEIYFTEAERSTTEQSASTKSFFIFFNKVHKCKERIFLVIFIL